MTIEKIKKWIYQHEMKLGRKPAIVPISEPERLEIMSDYSPHVRISGNGRDQICGLDTELTYWGGLTRQKILEMEVERFSMEQSIDEHQFAISQYKKEFTGMMVKRVTVHILTDITHLDVSFDWDRLAWLKGRFKWIARKWPVKRKTIRIEGKVLYPYLKIQAPADTHRVRFDLRPRPSEILCTDETAKELRFPNDKWKRKL